MLSAPGSPVVADPPAHAPSSAQASQQQRFAHAYPFRIATSPRGAALEIYAINEGFAPVNVTIELTKAKNTGFAPNNIGGDSTHLVPPHTRKLITMAVPLKKGRPLDFAYVHRLSFGDNLATVDQQHAYRLPISDGVLAVLRPFSGLPVSTNYFSSHHAFELLAPAGTVVVAARPGIVFLVSDSSIDSLTRRPTTLGAHVLVLHEDGSWGVYASLQPESIKVKPGDVLYVNQPIAAIAQNAISVDTYLIFGVARALGGLTAGTIPFKFTSKHVEEINPTLFTGPVSPDLEIKYPPRHLDDPWHPSERVVPTPAVITNYGDEGMTPAQRQALYRQRIIDHANAGRDTVGDSTMLVVLGAVAVGLSVVALFVAVVSGKASLSSGALGFMWRLLHGAQPSGALHFDPQDAKPPIVGPVVSEPTAQPDPSPRASSPTLPPQSSPSTPVSSADESPATEVDDHEPIPTQRLHDPGTLEIIRHVSHATPLGMLMTHSVPAMAVVSSATPRDVIDFVLIRASDASVVMCLLRADNHHLAHTLSASGIPHSVLPDTPTSDQVKSAVQGALHPSTKHALAR